MSKKIVILNGSPRAAGNTAKLAEAFAKGAKEAGNTVTAFMLDEMNIGGCKGCFGGGKDKCSPCVQKDDMDKIYPAYTEADVVVLASPVYYWSISGQIKTAFDRLFAVAEASEGTKNPVKDCALLMAAESWEFEEAEYYYDKMTGHIGWTNIGKVLVGDVLYVGDIEGNPALEKAFELGASIK